VKPIALNMLAALEEIRWSALRKLPISGMGEFPHGVTP